MIKDNPEAPHKAIIFIQAEIHEVTPEGLCKGVPVHKVERFPLIIEASDKNFAIKCLNEFIEEAKRRCN